jgi:hypothetical protein
MTSCPSTALQSLLWISAERLRAHKREACYYARLLARHLSQARHVAACSCHDGFLSCPDELSGDTEAAKGMLFFSSPNVKSLLNPIARK